jgi:hypothetical protein
MPSSGMLRRVALARTDVSKERIASIIRVTKFYTTIVFLRSLLRLLVTTNVAPSLLILVTLMMEAIFSSETSVLIRDTQCNIPEDSILQVNLII